MMSEKVSSELGDSALLKSSGDTRIRILTGPARTIIIGCRYSQHILEAHLKPGKNI